ncbi:unnamed protein product [Staurois parvus]|uniref:Secreted protein n=1 Tax=Staurois parvus TaxID=386267 RepID=A0ABN9AH70_9NEOB|nr:unnamed protein product [Staurois parvus]
MRCPWYLFHRLFWVWARTQGPYDPLLPGGPMSCQSAPVGQNLLSKSCCVQSQQSRVGGPMRCPWYFFHRLF